jgi:hypothetical protein
MRTRARARVCGFNSLCKGVVPFRGVHAGEWSALPPPRGTELTPCKGKQQHTHSRNARGAWPKRRKNRHG